jgi:hypothetical protein
MGAVSLAGGGRIGTEINIPEAKPKGKRIVSMAEAGTRDVLSRIVDTKIE